MNEFHYVSLEVAKQLQEAGIGFPESEKVWLHSVYMYTSGCTEDEVPKLVNRYIPHGQRISENPDVYKTLPRTRTLLPAPSLLEILDELPDSIEYNNEYYYILISKEGGWTVWYHNPENIKDIHACEAPTAPDACGLMRIKLRKDNYERSMETNKYL